MLRLFLVCSEFSSIVVEEALELGLFSLGKRRVGEHLITLKGGCRQCGQPLLPGSQPPNERTRPQAALGELSVAHWERVSVQKG